ncbi:MAG: glutathione transferase GstA [Vibrio sp.]
MKLYFTPGACSVSPHIVLEELGLDHQLEQVDLQTKRTVNGEDYLAVTQKGYIPALKLDNGHILTEGLVIAQYLADLKPEANLIPASGEERYQLQSLMVFISTELHKGMGALFNPNITPEARETVIAGLAKRFKWVEEQIGESGFAFGDHFTIADAYLFTVLNWTNFLKVDMNAYPVLQTYMQRHAKRPSVQAALKAEGLI